MPDLGEDVKGPWRVWAVPSCQHQQDSPQPDHRGPLFTLTPASPISLLNGVGMDENATTFYYSPELLEEIKRSDLLFLLY